MSEGRPSMRLCGVSAKVRAYCSSDLDSHVSFIRKNIADGKSGEWIAGQLNIEASRLRYYIRKMNMVRSAKRGLRLPYYPGTGPIK